MALIEVNPAPIVATCADCGSEGLITQNPAPRGRFNCPNCNTPSIARPALLAAIKAAKGV